MKKFLFITIIALVALFLIPAFVSLVMGLIGERTSFTSCWSAIDEYEISLSTNYIGNTIVDENKDGIDDNTGKNIQKVYIEPGDYERGSTGINPNKGYCPNFVEPNNTVKSSFDATTMSIIEKHLEDFDYSTYKPSEGGKYIKSLGGIFSKYYGQEVHVTTAGELQEVAEYVFGLMYLYGFDYFNGKSGERAPLQKQSSRAAMIRQSAQPLTR